MFSFSTPASAAIMDRKSVLEPCIRNKGSMSFWKLYLYPSLTSRFIWTARLGSIKISRSTATSFVSSLFPSCTITRPATERGLSNHGPQSIPPYFSTFNFTYWFSTFISGSSLIFKDGESLWLAAILKPVNSLQGTWNAMMADLFLVT